MWQASKQVYDVLCANTELDHPLCDECCATVTTTLETKLKDMLLEHNSLMCECYSAPANKSQLAVHLPRHVKPSSTLTLLCRTRSPR